MTRLPEDEQELRNVADTALAALSRRQLTDAIETCERRARAATHEPGGGGQRGGSDEGRAYNEDRAASWSAAAETFRGERRRRY